MKILLFLRGEIDREITSMKYYIIAGEASGDLHGAGLITAILQADPQAEFRFWGGDLMLKACQGQGFLVKHYRTLAFMGIGQVLKNLFAIFRNFSDCKKDLLAFRPDATIFIDYSGFNLRIARWLKPQRAAWNGRAYYYIAPQLWATRPKRIHTLKACVEEVFVILPFEPAFYQKYGYEATYVGHPLLDTVAQFVPNPDFRTQNSLDARPIVAILAGSRRQEIKSMLPVMVGIIHKHPDLQFVIGAAPSFGLDFYENLLAECIDAETRQKVCIVQHQTYDLLANSWAALVTSGTASLETGLFKVPQTVCYRTSAFLYWVVKKIIQVKYISLVNLILQRQAAPELIQADLSPENLEAFLNQLKTQPDYRLGFERDYTELWQALGSKGAAQRVALAISQPKLLH